MNFVLLLLTSIWFRARLCHAQFIRVTVHGDDLSTSESGDCFAGKADPRWRVRVSADSARTWSYWNEDRDGISGGGYQGISKANLIRQRVVSSSENLVIELDAYEHDSRVCDNFGGGGPHDGECGGYGGRVTTRFTSRAACRDHIVEIIRTCNSDKTTVTWKAKIEYSYDYKHGDIYTCRATPPSPRPTPTPTDTPSTSPTPEPTGHPSKTPTVSPSLTPTSTPTASPSGSPSPQPTNSPTGAPFVPNRGFIFDQDMMIFVGAGGGGLVGLLALALLFFRPGRSKSRDEDMEAKLQAPGSTFEHELTPKEMAALHIKPAGRRTTLEGTNVQEWIKSLENEEKKENLNILQAMTVMFDFEAENDDELGAKAGTRLFCLDQRGEWYVARDPQTGQHGIIPASYVQLDV